MYEDWSNDWKPKTVEESIDAGVHPAVAELRLREAAKQRTVNEPRLKCFLWWNEDAIVGKRWHGQSRSAPEVDVNKMNTLDPTFDPS